MAETKLIKKSAKDFFSKILIFSDGACSGNPGPGGWGSVIVFPEGEVLELGGGSDHTTNNDMELTASIRALQKIKDRNEEVVFYTDSTYLIRGITQWIWGWMRNGWKTAEGNEVSNQDRWKDLVGLVRARGSGAKIEWLYSRGHVGTPGNERCDEIAVAFSQKKWVSLYQGSLLKYQIAIYDVPEDGSLPPMREKTEKKPAFSYLSVIGGEVLRHRDWSSCERRVKGRSGAKFKKALSEQDELEILKSWGFSSPGIIKDE